MKAATEETDDGLTPAEVREVFEGLQSEARPAARAIEAAEVCRAIVRQRRLSEEQNNAFAARGLADFVRRSLTMKTESGVFYAQPVKRTGGTVGFFQPALFDIEDARGWVAEKNRETMADRTSILPTYRLLTERFGDELPPLVTIDGD